MGARDMQGAARAGWMALLFGSLFMSCSGLMLFLFSKPIARIYTPEPDVISAGAVLLLVAAIFQLFDGLQVVATGALRGTGNTRIAMLANFVGYWVIGLPLGAFLCFKLKLGAVGMWAGLCVALVLIGCALVGVWHSVIKRLIISPSAAPPLKHASLN
jgi:MATE family multidrug resistance protein